MIPVKLQRGFTLIETMIALLIFSIGLMGMAALMVLSVKTNQSAYLRTQASFLAQSMADRMRANTSLINSYNGSYSYATAGASDSCAAAACSPLAMVDRDRAVWSQQLIDSLPNPTAVVACNGGVLGTALHAGAAPFSGLCSLTISWNEATLRRGELGAAPEDAVADMQTFAWVFQP